MRVAMKLIVQYNSGTWRHLLHSFLNRGGHYWDSKKTGSEQQFPGEATLSLDNLLQMICSFKSKQTTELKLTNWIWKKKSLPVSVKWASDVKRIGTSFVVSSRAKSIHKATVGKRCLHKERETVKILFHATSYLKKEIFLVVCLAPSVKLWNYFD